MEGSGFMKARWNRGWSGADLKCFVPELFTERVKLSQGPQASALLFGWRTSRCGGQGWGFAGGRFDQETNAADVEVFFKAVQLEEIG